MIDRSRWYNTPVAKRGRNYNYCCIHQTLGVMPAIQAGPSGRVRKIEELVRLLETAEAKVIANGALKCGKYKAKASD
jgi:hypothetical protein